MFNSRKTLRYLISLAFLLLLALIMLVFSFWMDNINGSVALVRDHYNATQTSDEVNYQATLFARANFLSPTP